MAPEDNIMDVTEDDILATRLVDPGWYKWRVEKLKIKTAKSLKTTNHFYTVRGLTEDAKGAVVLMNLNSALKGRILSFMKACSGGEIKPGKLNLNAPVEKKSVFWGKLRHRDFDGEEQNDIYSFLPENANPLSEEPEEDKEEKTAKK